MFIIIICFVYKIFALTIRNIIPYPERTFQSRMFTSLRKSSSVSSFTLACSRFTVVYRVSFIFHLNAFLVPVCTRGLPRENGIGLVCTRRFSFHEFYNFLLFNLCNFYFFGRLFFTHDIYPHPHPRHTSTTHDPRPTIHDQRHLATLAANIFLY